MSLVKGIFCFGGLAAVLVPGLTQPAQAQEAPPPTASQSTIEDGELIYARDVHHSIGAPFFPGATHQAVTAPTNAIIATISNGIAPLSDIEAAGVTGSLRGTIEGIVPTALAPLMRDQAGSRTENIGGAPIGNMSGGSAISGAMGALAGALDSLSAITGGRP
jgi:hypothetical protein